MLAGPIKLVLNKRQLKQLRVGVTDIGVGVFLGLLFWSIFAVVAVVVF